MTKEFKRNQQTGLFSGSGLLMLAVVCAAAMGCTSQQETHATGSSAAGSTALADMSVVQPKKRVTVQRSGVFVKGEHSTSGTARLVDRDGVMTLELDEAFTTSTAGPDLVVALHRSADVIGSTIPPAFPIKEGDYVVLAPLQSYNGAQSYTVPAEVQTDDFKSVVIWCRRFNATFGAARLEPLP